MKMNENRRKFIAGLITGLIVFGALTFYATITRAVNPSIVYAYPSNGATFVDVWRGHGVNITVNVSDGDGDLQQVVLKWNNSGTWDTFYDSGALGGVSYHNVTVLNSNFTGSWETYEWQICAKDGVGWTNTTYSFTTEYVWGDPVMIFGDFSSSPIDITWSVMYKNNTNDYYLVVYCDGIDAKRTSNEGLDWIIQPSEDVGNYKEVYNAFTYNGHPYFLIRYDDGYRANLYYATYNGSAWNIGDTSLDLSKSADTWSNAGASFGADIKYYDGKWNIVTAGSYASYETCLKHYYGTPPNSWTAGASLTGSYGSKNKEYAFPQLEILDGLLVLVYRDPNDDLHWQTYDGVVWTDRGIIESDITGSTSSGAGTNYGIGVIKDPINNQLVLVYKNTSGNLYYRVLSDISSGWSEAHLLFQPESGYSIKYPHVSYIDHRLVVTFAYNIRGNYNIYMISAPEYLSSASGGVLKQYNRIQFPDAIPNQKNVNSSVFYFENINSRAINWINWSFSDIGSIQCENNIRLWGSTDNSSWTLIGTTDANGYINMTTTTWASGLPWQAGEKRYFKIEILDIGSVSEDLHSLDEGIILKVGLE